MSNTLDDADRAAARAGRLPQSPSAPSLGDTQATLGVHLDAAAVSWNQNTKQTLSISFIDTLLLQFTMHSTDSVQLKPQTYKSSFYSFLHNKF